MTGLAVTRYREENRMFTLYQILLIAIAVLIGSLLTSEIAAPFQHGWAYPLLLAGLSHLLVFTMYMHRNDVRRHG